MSVAIRADVPIQHSSCRDHFKSCYQSNLASGALFPVTMYGAFVPQALTALPPQIGRGHAVVIIARRPVFDEAGRPTYRIIFEQLQTKDGGESYILVQYAANIIAVDQWQADASPRDVELLPNRSFEQGGSATSSSQLPLTAVPPGLQAAHPKSQSSQSTPSIISATFDVEATGCQSQ